MAFSYCAKSTYRETEQEEEEEEDGGSAAVKRYHEERLPITESVVNDDFLFPADAPQKVCVGSGGIWHGLLVTCQFSISALGGASSRVGFLPGSPPPAARSPRRLLEEPNARGSLISRLLRP